MRFILFPSKKKKKEEKRRNEKRREEKRREEKRKERQEAKRNFIVQKKMSIDVLSKKKCFWILKSGHH